MCSSFPVLGKFCFHFDLRSGLYAVATFRTIVWFAFIIFIFINYATREQISKDELTRDDILAGNVTELFSSDQGASVDEAGKSNANSAGNVDKGAVELTM